MAGYGNIANLTAPGRPKGVKNKWKPLTMQHLVECMESNNYDPVIDAIKAAQHPECPFAVRQRIAEVFINKLYPTLKATEHSGSVEQRNLSIQWNVDSSTQSPNEQPHDIITHEQTIDLTLDETPVDTVGRTPEITLDTTVKDE